MAEVTNRIVQAVLSKTYSLKAQWGVGLDRMLGAINNRWIQCDLGILLPGEGTPCKRYDRTYDRKELWEDLEAAERRKATRNAYL